MPVIRFASPLTWPDNVAVTPRTLQRTDNGFSPQMTLAEAINYLDDELKEIQPAMAVLSLDVDQPLVDRLRKKVGSRTGACLHFKYQNRPYVLTCDRWMAVEHNVYALHLVFRQWHNMVRWGVGSMAQLLGGFEANRMPLEEVIAPAASALPQWMQALGLGPTATLDDAVAVYHRRAKTVAHDDDALTHLNIVMEDARSFFAGRS